MQYVGHVRQPVDTTYIYPTDGIYPTHSGVNHLASYDGVLYIVCRTDGEADLLLWSENDTGQIKRPLRAPLYVRRSQVAYLVHGTVVSRRFGPRIVLTVGNALYFLSVRMKCATRVTIFDCIEQIHSLGYLPATEARGSVYLAAGESGLCFFDTSKKKHTYYPCKGLGISRAVVDPQSGRVIVGYENGEVSFSTLSLSNNPYHGHRYRRHHDRILGITFLGRMLLTLSEEGVVYLWTYAHNRPPLCARFLASRSREALIGKESPKATVLASCPQSGWVAVGYADGNIQVANIHDGAVSRESGYAHSGPVLGLTFSSKIPGRLYSAGCEGSIRIWDNSPIQRPKPQEESFRWLDL